MKKISGIVLLSAILLSACEKEFTIPLPTADYRPVVNTLLSQDSLVYVRVTLSARPDGDGPGEPGSATVQLYEDGVLKETLQASDSSGKKYYVSTGRVVAGHTYRVTAAVPGYEMAEGADVIPDRQTFSVSGKTSYLALGQDNDEEINLHFSLTHHGAGKGYYQYRVFAYYRVVAGISGGTDTTWREERQLLHFHNKNQGSSLFDETDSYTGNTGNIPDSRVLEPGTTVDVTLAGNDWYYGSDTDSLQVEVTQLTEHTHKYLQTLKTAMNSNDDPTAEKAIMYSNVKNGFGIVGGMATRKESFSRP